MGIVKEKNLYKFWLDGKAKPYTLDVNTGVMIGLRGAQLQNIPASVISMCGGRENWVCKFLRWSNNPTAFGRTDFTRLLQMCDKLDAIGLLTDADTLMGLVRYIDVLESYFKEFTAYARNHADSERVIQEFSCDRAKTVWYAKHNFHFDEHFTEEMAEWLYDKGARDRIFADQYIDRFAYYLARGVWDYYGGTDRSWEMANVFQRFIEYTTALGWEMEKGDFFRQFINARRAYNAKREEMELRGFMLAQQKNLEALSFETEDYVVVIPMNPNDLIAEGQMQHNCVGGYSNAVREGRKNVVFIRKKTDINKPYITCDILASVGKINQYLLAYNRRTTDAADIKFYELYQKHLSENWEMGD